MESQKCKNCVYFSVYYKKVISSFARLQNGFCSKYDKIQIRSECCENFKNNEQNKKRKENILLINLGQALKSINVIAEILKETQSDKENIY